MSGDATTRGQALGDDGDAIAVGELIAGKYRVERQLGVGGMGVVVAVTHLQLGEPYALKFLRGRAASDEGAIERFLREARAAVRIKSEHVVHVSDVGQLPNGSPYIVMEYLSGQDLAQVLQASGPLQVRDAVDYLVQACAGIGEAHAKGIVHRDLKPSNLFLTARSDGSPLIKVLDFGISKLSHDQDLPSLTETHDVFGSPAYMPPEQIRSAKNVDARSDVWALGVILHELLAGALPFDGETASSLLAAIAADEPRSARAHRPDVSEDLARIIRRCLEKSPAARFASVAELATALAPFASPDGVTLAQRVVRRTSIVAPRMESRAAHAPSTAFATTEREPRKSVFRRAPTLAVVALVVLMIGAAVYVRRSPARIDPLPPTPAAIAAAATTDAPPVVATSVTAIAPTVTATAPTVSAAAPKAPPTPSFTARPAVVRTPGPAAPKPTASASSAPRGTNSETDTSH